MKKLLAFLLPFAFLFTVILTVHAAEATTPTGIPLSEVGTRIDELVANYMHEFTPGLAIAVVKDGEIIFLRGYGYADIERQVPVDPANTVFEYASISKLFVYVSVMQLVEDGRLDLDVDIHNYLPEDLARQFNFGKSFTMRDLLNHSAGFGQFNFNLAQDAENVTIRRTLREALLATQPPQIFEPGTATGYANFSSALAAYVVSYISGQEFSEFERTNIFVPLGMNNTRNQPDWFGDSVFMQSLARGHVSNGSGDFDISPWLYLTTYPAGAVRGTAEDLAQFAIALMPLDGESGPLFDNRNALDLMLSPSYSGLRILRGTHHGFFSYDGIYPTVGHSGGSPGFGAQFVIVPSQRFGVVILGNAQATNAGSVVFYEKILDLLLGNTRDLVPPSPGNLPNAARVAGTYVSLERSEGNILEPFNILLNRHIRVEAVDENTITLTMGGATVTYRQIEPYIFRAVYANCAIGLQHARRMYEIYFRMENGQPIGISSSFINDATIQTFGQSLGAFLGGIVILIIALLFFLIMPPILVVKFLRKKEKSTTMFNRCSTGLLLCGTLLLINWLILEVRFMATISFATTKIIVPHIWFNYILLPLTAVAFVASLVFYKSGAVTKGRNVLYFFTIALLGAFLFVLWQWNFFVMK